MTPKLASAGNGKTEQKIHAPRKLDIACGKNKQPGFKGIDISGDADIVHNLEVFPWPIKTNSVEQAFCSHYVEHIPHWSPQHPILDVGEQNIDGWWLFFDELYRICKAEATVEIVHPYVMTTRAFWDPTHTRFIHEMTWYYLDPAWREANGLDHYPVSADFEVVTIDGGFINGFESRNHEQQNFARTHYWNAISDIRVILKARK